MIFWIASYPKNGNTWLRSLLSAYYYTKDGIFVNDKILKNIPQFPEKNIFPVLSMINQIQFLLQDIGLKHKKLLTKIKK